MIQDKKGHAVRVSRLLEYIRGEQIFIEVKDNKFRKRNNYTLNIRYTTKLNKEYQGFYVASYVRADEERRYVK